MTYEVIGTPQVQTDYSTDEWQTVMVIGLKRADGQTGDVWIIAGVPDSEQGSSQAARTQSGYEDVWLFGDSVDSWCPESFQTPDPQDDDNAWAGGKPTYFVVARDVLWACRKAALAAHRERYRAEYA